MAGAAVTLEKDCKTSGPQADMAHGSCIFDPQVIVLTLHLPFSSTISAETVCERERWKADFEGKEWRRGV